LAIAVIKRKLSPIGGRLTLSPTAAVTTIP
jgi:hypothetical protein